MIKHFFNFIITGITVVLTYILYFIFAFITVFVLGIPIGFGIKVVMHAVDMLYNWIV